MTQEKKQTAVEWLLWELSKVGYLPDGVPEEIHKQAKAMEREQIEEAFNEGKGMIISPDAMIYYIETYGKEADHGK